MKTSIIILITFSCLIGVIVLYVIIRLFFDFIKKSYYEKLCLSSYSFLNKYVGLFTIIVGEIGAGKTTFASGLTNYRTLFKMQQAQDKIEEILIKFYDVDFNRINEIIESLYFKGDFNFKNITNPSYILNYILISRIHPNSPKDLRIYDDIFGGSLVYKKTNKEIDFNHCLRLLDKTFKEELYLDSDDKVVNSKGEFVNIKTKEKELIYEDFYEFEYDDLGNIIFDEKFEAKFKFINGNKNNSEPKRERVFLDNGLSYLDGYSILRDYIKAYLALLRNNYVYFINRKFFSRITFNYAKDFDEKLLDIKDSWLNKNYKIDDYSVLFWDEVALTDKKSTNFQNFAKSDSGSDAFLRLVRQIGKETIDVIKTVQKYERVVLAERELITSVIHISSRKEYIVGKFKYSVICFLLNITLKFNSYINKKLANISNLIKFKDISYLKKKINKNDFYSLSDKDLAKYQKLKNRYDLKESKLRKFINKLSVIKDKLYASSLLEYQGIIYFNGNDVGKDITSLSKSQAMKFKVYFPIRYCYGSTDTFAYSIVGDFLSLKSINSMDYYENTSNYPDSSLNNREVFVAKILTKDSVKNEINKNISKKALKALDKENSDQNDIY